MMVIDNKMNRCLNEEVVVEVQYAFTDVNTYLGESLDFSKVWGN